MSNSSPQLQNKPSILDQLSAMVAPISREYKTSAAKDLIDRALKDNYYIEAICLAEQYLLESGLAFLGIPRKATHKIQLVGIADVLLHNHILTNKERRFVEELGQSRNEWAHRALRKGRVWQAELIKTTRKATNLADLILLRGYKYLITRNILNERQDLLLMLILNFARRLQLMNKLDTDTTLQEVMNTISKLANRLQDKEPAQFMLYATAPKPNHK